MSERSAGCEGCKFLKRCDYGYSNWTVMSSDVDCLKSLNPALPLDDDVESQKFNAALAFGETCAGRVEGDGPWFDVDGVSTPEDYKDDPEMYALLTRTSETP